MTRIRVLDVLTALSLTALSIFGARAWQRRADPDVALAYSDDLRELLALGTRKTGEVMKARSGVIGHYDGLVQTSAAIDRVLVRLEHVPEYLSEPARQQLASSLTEVRRTHEQAGLLVDRFKRQSSVLRNSVRYLPSLALEIDEHLSRDPEAQPTVQALNTLVRNELLLQGWQEGLIAQRVRHGIEQLDEAVSGLPPASRRRVALALAHARKVEKLTPSVNAITRRIIALPMVERTRALMAAFEAHHQRAGQRTDRDAVIVFALAMATLLLGVASVITRMRRSAADLRQTRDRLEEAVGSLREEQAKQRELADLKSRFVSMTSHEFRTPLSVIMSSSEMLEAYADRWSAEKKADHFGRIRSSAMGMTRMLEDILLIGKSDAGALQFDPHEVDLSAFCHDVLDAVGNATGDGARIAYGGLEGEALATVDDALLRHVLENLLSNALKYSKRPAPVQFTVERQNGSVVFTVADAGIGISEADQVRLFESFHRGSNVGQISGTGLGLAIVKRAVEMHRGSVTVESAVGVGSTFVVSIPADGRGA